MKKLFITLICALAIIGLAGCTTAPIDNPADFKLPAHVQKIEDDTNDILKKRGHKGVEIIDYRDNGRVLWMWTDNIETPKTSCDFVIVLGIHERSGEERTYIPLFVITDQNSPDPCREGYDLYRQNEKEKLEDGKKKMGI